MKSKLLFAVLFLSLGALAQKAVLQKDSNGNYVEVKTTRSHKEAVLTGNVFLKDGVKYPIYQSASGKFFIIKKSKKTGKEYHQYLTLQ
jgi:hypothetical protein